MNAPDVILTFLQFMEALTSCTFSLSQLRYGHNYSFRRFIGVAVQSNGLRRMFNDTPNYKKAPNTCSSVQVDSLLQNTSVMGIKVAEKSI